MGDQIKAIATQLTGLLTAVVMILGTLHVLKPDQIDPIVQYLTTAVILGGSVVAGVVLIWKDRSHKEAIQENKVSAAQVVVNALPEHKEALALSLGLPGPPPVVTEPPAPLARGPLTDAEMKQIAAYMQGVGKS